MAKLPRRRPHDALACFLFVLCRVSHYLLDHMHHRRITDENRM
jgi:hypothetical protein